MYEICGVNVSPPTIGHTFAVLWNNTNKVRYVALQRCNSFRGAFMVIWIDETSSDSRDQSQEYGYARFCVIV